MPVLFAVVLLVVQLPLLELIMLDDNFAVMVEFAAVVFVLLEVDIVFSLGAIPSIRP